METKDLVVVQKNITDAVSKRVNELVKNNELNLPADYSPGNALRSAFLILQDTQDKNKQPVLRVCEPNSIANTLFNMVVQGLNPGKNQCYFVAYGNKLTLMRSYFGAVALAKRVCPEIADVSAEVVYKSDKLTYRIQNGRKIIDEHLQDFASIGSEIVGAYAVVVGHDGVVLNTVLMPMDRIKASWAQSAMKPVQANGELNPNSTHAKFTEEMCKKTVIAAACKPFINSSSDATLMESLTQEDEVRAEVDYTENANQEEIDILIESPREESPDEEPESTLEPTAPPIPETVEEGPGF